MEKINSVVTLALLMGHKSNTGFVTSW